MGGWVSDGVGSGQNTKNLETPPPMGGCVGGKLLTESR